MAKAPAVAPEVAEEQPFVDAPTAPSFAASVSNIAYMKTPANPLGALVTGMGYDPAIATTKTTTTMLMGGQAMTIGYSAPTPQ